MKDVLTLLDEKKAMDVVILQASEIERMRVLCDYMVILTCTGHRHMKIVADHVVDHFRLKGMLVEMEDEDGIVRAMPPSAEDPNSEEWMLVDLQHIIVQIFSREGRAKVGWTEYACCSFYLPLSSCVTSATCPAIQEVDALNFLYVWT